METLTAVANVVVGVLVRLGVPLLLTAGAIWLLRRLDARWQREAEQTRTLVPQVPVARCWEERNCPPERAVHCPAYQDQSQPCWQTFRDGQGNLQERCLACQLFQQAAVPTSTRPRVLS
jgi:hypothetical protein